MLNGVAQLMYDHVVGKFDGKAHEPPVKIEIPET